jgi:gliding motility-associated-like protein
MKKLNTILTSAVIALLCCLNFSGTAQNGAKTIAVDNFFNHVFDSDSLSGFDESANSAMAVSNGCYGNEFKMFMNRAKRQFINAKYNVNAPLPSLPYVVGPVTMPTKLAKSSALPSSGACANEDFEDNAANSGPQIGGVVNGWSFFGGAGANFCNPPVVAGATNNYTVFNGPSTDINMGTTAANITSSYFDAISNTQPAGSCYVRLNDISSGGKVIRMSKTYTITPSNALFQYAYRAVLNNPGHACCDQPGFKITVTITNTVTNTSTVLSCPQVSVAAGTACGTSSTAPTFSAGASGYQYTAWIPSSIDLSGNLGNAVTLDVYSIDCALGGHPGYVYFDAKCSPMTIVGNGNQFPAGTPSINIPTCGSNGATITLPGGLGPYSWVGGILNPVPPSYSSPSYTNQVYTTSVSGPYTVVMNPAGSCVPITKTLNVVVTPAPQLFASIIQAGCSSTAAIATCTAAGSASVNPSIIWSPTPFALANSSTQATYLPPGTSTVLTVTATDNNNCPISKTLSLLPAPPAVTFSVINTSLSTSITCANPVVTLSVTTSYTYGALSYSWTSNSFTSSATTASITQAQTVQATAWDPLTGCSANTVIVVPINTIAPTSTVNPLTQTISCGPGSIQTFTSVVSSTNTAYSHCWTSPSGPPAVCNTSSVSLYSGSFPGTYTVVVTNPANGCINTKTVSLTSSAGFPTFNVTSSSNFSIGCAPSKNTTTLNFVNGQTNPVPGGAITYTILPPAYTGTYNLGAVTSTVLSTPGIYTVIARDPSNSCETRINVPVIQNTVSPTSVISVSNNPVNTFALSCFTPSIIAVGSSTVPNANLTWITPSATNIPQSTITIAVTSNTATTSIGTYSLKVEDPNNGCISFNPFPITQSIQTPSPSITNVNTPTFVSCFGIPVALKNSSTATPTTVGSPNAIAWAGPSPQIPAGAQSQYNAYVAGVYTMTVRNTGNGCIASGTIQVFDNVIPPIYPTPIAPFILDCSLPSVKIGVAPTNSTATFQYTWTAEDPGNQQGITPPTSIGSPFTNVTQPGEYRVVVFNPLNGCTATQTYQVLPGDLTVGFTASPVNGFAPLAVSFVNTSTSSGTIAPTASITSNWNFGNGSPIVTTTVNSSQSAIYNNPGTYTVVLNGKKGSCVGTATQVIVVDIPSKLTVPNVFTPNGDGANDKFKLLTQNLTNIEATIFDRWGNKVFEMTSDKGNIEWDGMNLYGKESANGTYFYVIKANGKDGKDYIEKGTVSLYR